MFTSQFFINRGNIQQSLHNKLNNKNNESLHCTYFSKKSQPLVRQDRNGTPFTMWPTQMLSLITLSQMFWDFKTFLFITLRILSGQFHSKYEQIQQIPSQNTGQFRERKGVVIGLPDIGVFCKFLRLWNAMYSCPNSMNKRAYISTL